MFELILATVSNCIWAIVFACGIAYCEAYKPIYRQMIDIPPIKDEEIAKIGLGVLSFSKFTTTTIFFYRNTDIDWGGWLILGLPIIILLSLMYIHGKNRWKYREIDKCYSDKSKEYNERREFLADYERRHHAYAVHWFRFTTIVMIINLITSFVWASNPS